MQSDKAFSSKIEGDMRFILGCVTTALKRARERQREVATGTKDPVYRYLSDKQNRNGKFGVVRRLVRDDPEFVTDGGDVLGAWDCIDSNRKKKFNANIKQFFEEGAWVWWSDEATEGTEGTRGVET